MCYRYLKFSVIQSKKGIKFKKEKWSCALCKMNSLPLSWQPRLKRIISKGLDRGNTQTLPPHSITNISIFSFTRKEGQFRESNFCSKASQRACRFPRSSTFGALSEMSTSLQDEWRSFWSSQRLTTLSIMAIPAHNSMRTVKGEEGLRIHYDSFDKSSSFLFWFLFPTNLNVLSFSSSVIWLQLWILEMVWRGRVGEWNEEGSEMESQTSTKEREQKELLSEFPVSETHSIWIDLIKA